MSTRSRHRAGLPARKADPVIEALSRPLAFCARYFPHIFTKAFCSMHQEWEWELMYGGQRQNWEAPREHGKTRIITIGYVLWRLYCWLRAKRDGAAGIYDEHIAIFSVTEDIAMARLRQVRAEIESNELLKADFGEVLRAEPWSDNKIVFAEANNKADPTVAAYGPGGTGLGWRILTAILDDIEDPNHVQEQEQREKLARWVQFVLEPMMLPEGLVVNICTPWNPNSLPETLKKNDGWTSLGWEAIIDEQDNRVQWPENWPLSRLLAKKKLIGPIAFAQQYQCRPIAQEEAKLHPLGSYDPTLLKFNGGTWSYDGKALNVCAAVDPQLSEKESRKHDDMAILTAGIDEDGDIYVLEALDGQWSFDDGVEQIYQAFRRWKSMSVVVEDNNFQAAYRQALEKKGVPCRGVKHTTDKLTRMVARLDPISAAGKIHALSSMGKLHEQWATLGHTAHDDVIDAFEMVVQELQGMGTPTGRIIVNRGGLSAARRGGMQAPAWIRTRYD